MLLRPRCLCRLLVNSTVLSPHTPQQLDSHAIDLNSSCYGPTRVELLYSAKVTLQKTVLRGFSYNDGMEQDSMQLVTRLATLLCQKNLKICTAESCTGGLIAKSLTDLAGSSDWFECGFVTYSNRAKTAMIDVPGSVISEYGAVSEAVATAMVNGALRNSAAQVAIAVTGVAGPGGGSADKPVGTVWIAVASENQLVAKKHFFDGDRAAIRVATMLGAIEMVLQLLGNY
jgi:nicotinamide-nucleotide amidase